MMNKQSPIGTDAGGQQIPRVASRIIFFGIVELLWLAVSQQGQLTVRKQELHGASVLS